MVNTELASGVITSYSIHYTKLYELEGLSNAPVEFTTSIVSFERVFEIIDLKEDIPEKENAVILDQVKGALAFEQVYFYFV